MNSPAVRITSADREKLRTTQAKLRRVRLARAHILQELTTDLAELLGARAALALRPQLFGDRWSLDFLYAAPANAATRAVLDSFEHAVRSYRGRRFGVYNPMRPEPDQRNRVIRPTALLGADWETHPLNVRAFRDAGWHDQLRVLVCKGQGLLAWIGALRSHPFDAREAALLRALVADLRGRLVLERRLDTTELHEAALLAALELLPTAAFIITADGAVRHANQAATALLERQRGCVRAALAVHVARACAEAENWTSSTAFDSCGLAFEVTRIEAPGLPEQWLALGHLQRLQLAERIQRAAREWRLTAREQQVLALLSAGNSNTQIVAELGCSPRTFEIHAAHLCRKAGVDGCAGVVARLLQS